MQIIAGIVEHRIAEEFSSQTFVVNMISFIARIINSYWGTQVGIISCNLNSSCLFSFFLLKNIIFFIFTFLAQFIYF